MQLCNTTHYQDYNLEDSLGYLANRAARSLVNRLNHNFAEAGHDVTAEQWGLLLELWHQDGQCQQHLANNAGKDKTSIIRLIDGLEKRNLVVRIPCQIDRRHKLIYLTNRGKALQKELIPLVQKTLSEAQRDVAPKQMDNCKDVLQKIYRNLCNS